MIGGILTTETRNIVTLDQTLSKGAAQIIRGKTKCPVRMLVEKRSTRYSEKVCRRRDVTPRT